MRETEKPRLQIRRNLKSTFKTTSDHDVSSTRHALEFTGRTDQLRAAAKDAPGERSSAGYRDVSLLAECDDGPRPDLEADPNANHRARRIRTPRKFHPSRPRRRSIPPPHTGATRKTIYDDGVERRLRNKRQPEKIQADHVFNFFLPRPITSPGVDCDPGGLPVLITMPGGH
jgi:hypothetical protein